MSQPDSTADHDADDGRDPDEHRHAGGDPAAVVDLSAHRRTPSGVRVARVETEPMSPRVETEVVDLLGVLVDQWATGQQTTPGRDQRAA